MAIGAVVDDCTQYMPIVHSPVCGCGSCQAIFSGGFMTTATGVTISGNEIARNPDMPETVAVPRYADSIRLSCSAQRGLRDNMIARYGTDGAAVYAVDLIALGNCVPTTRRHITQQLNGFFA